MSDRDAYEGAREDLLHWKRRAQVAEETLRGTDATEPDCWAILTPNGSKLVSPEEAKGALRAYPLYRARGVDLPDGAQRHE